MQKKIKLSALFIISMMTTSCLSLLSSNEQLVRVNANVPNVRVTIIKEGRILQEARLPADIEIQRQPGLVAVFSAPGYHTISRTIQPTFSTGRCLTSSCLSVLTLGWGLLFDFWNEAFYSYPDLMEVEMIPLTEDYAMFSVRLEPVIIKNKSALRIKIP